MSAGLGGSVDSSDVDAEDTSASPATVGCAGVQVVFVMVVGDVGKLRGSSKHTLLRFDTGDESGLTTVPSLSGAVIHCRALRGESSAPDDDARLAPDL